MIAILGGVTLVLLIMVLVFLLIIRVLHNMCRSDEKIVDTYEIMECDYNRLVINYKHLAQKLEAYKRIIDTYRES